MGLLSSYRMEEECGKELYHAVSGELRVGLQDAVCGRVIARSIHCVGTSLVEGGGKAHIARVPASDCYFRHDVWSAVLVVLVRSGCL